MRGPNLYNIRPTRDVLMPQGCVACRGATAGMSGMEAGCIRQSVLLGARGLVKGLIRDLPITPAQGRRGTLRRRATLRTLQVCRLWSCFEGDWKDDHRNYASKGLGD